MSHVGTRAWCDDAVPRISGGRLAVFAVASPTPMEVIVGVEGDPSAVEETQRLFRDELAAAGALRGVHVRFEPAPPGGAHN